MNEVALPEKDEESERALAWLAGFEVKTNEDAALLDSYCMAAKKREKDGEALFRAEIKAADELHNNLIAKLKGYIGPAVRFRELAKPKIKAFNDERDRLDALEQRRLQAAADKLAEDQKIADAALAEISGDREGAEEIMAQPVESHPVYVPRSAPKLQTVVRSIPDTQKIAAAVAAGVRTIAGVVIFAEWKAKVVEAAKVPAQYRRAS